MKNKKIAKKQDKKISKKTTFAEVIEKNPESIGVFLDCGMHCIGCPMSRHETIEQGALAHGVNPDKLIEKLNKKIIKNKNRR
jgi:hybrid cluster-associated redox disulfide protein